MAHLFSSHTIQQAGHHLSHFLIGPFKQALTLRHLKQTGPLSDDDLEVIHDLGLEIDQGKIIKIIPWEQRHQSVVPQIHLDKPYVITPGLVDCHTHLCYAGNRAMDYQYRLAGMSYTEMAQRGGGIRYTMAKTREATALELLSLLKKRIISHISKGITTIEIKSGYGLSVEAEYLHLKLINQLKQESHFNLIPTCLAAHVCPPEFKDKEAYLSLMAKTLLPQLKAEGLCQRVDAFVEESAFPAEIVSDYLKQAQALGFDLTIHADQFSQQGAQLAGALKAKSADHLEVSQQEDLEALKKGDVVAVALPGASMGLGCGYAPVRQALDLGLSVAIASDWNPGSAPMGDLMLQASVMGMACRLNSAELWAGMTVRAAKALGLTGVGQIEMGYRADLLIYDCEQWQDILYQQGQLKPKWVIVNGNVSI